MEKCKKCGSVLKKEEIGLHKRLINRGDTEFLCIDCLAEFFGCGTDLLESKIKHFKHLGCTLFECEDA